MAAANRCQTQADPVLLAQQSRDATEGKFRRRRQRRAAASGGSWGAAQPEASAIAPWGEWPAAATSHLEVFPAGE
jgi:hypothetical protein